MHLIVVIRLRVTFLDPCDIHVDDRLPVGPIPTLQTTECSQLLTKQVSPSVSYIASSLLWWVF